MPRLSAIDRERAIGQLQAGNRPAAIANVMGVATSTICRLWTRFQASGSTRDGARSGRPRVTTARQDRVIYRQHLRQPFLPATETSRNTVGTHGAPISGTMTRRQPPVLQAPCSPHIAYCTAQAAATAVGTSTPQLEPAAVAGHPFYGRKPLLHQPRRRPHQGVAKTQPEVRRQQHPATQRLGRPQRHNLGWDRPQPSCGPRGLPRHRPWAWKRRECTAVHQPGPGTHSRAVLPTPRQPYLSAGQRLPPHREGHHGLPAAEQHQGDALALPEPGYESH
ncbi:hypothetical protein V1264_008423 [Littorina saxatilis]|uniref:Uncharacterized protein n=1 Tax=Littorina saxatilis TaxID=31220 RepID=A0AAN9ATL6_9CAEN